MRLAFVFALGAALVDVALPGHGDALVVEPSRSPAPIVVATHGAWDRAEAHCELWQRITRGRAFVVCPRGKPTKNGFAPAEALYYYPDEIELRREVAAAVESARARFGDRLDASAPIYAGFSQGAIQGAVMLPSSDVHFARAVLVEGGHKWSAESAARFAAHGGERVLFVCGTKSCDDDATAASRILSGAGVATKVVYAPGAGHTYGGEVERDLDEAFAWIARGDPRFE